MITATGPGTGVTSAFKIVLGHTRDSAARLGGRQAAVAHVRPWSAPASSAAGGRPTQR